jgi:hypothetical protein
MPDRTTIVMPARLKAQAVARAREQKISFGEFVRRAVKNQLATLPKRRGKKKTGDPFWDNLKFYEGGPSDVSVRHDDYIYGDEP